LTTQTGTSDAVVVIRFLVVGFSLHPRGRHAILVLQSLLWHPHTWGDDDRPDRRGLVATILLGVRACIATPNGTSDLGVAARFSIVGSLTFLLGRCVFSAVVKPKM
jgi:hypothetical protein